MIPVRLIRTSAFRLSLIYACVFSLMSALAFSFIYWSTARNIQQQTDSRLQLETDVLMNLYNSRKLPALLDTIRRRNSQDPHTSFFIYSLTRGLVSGLADPAIARQLRQAGSGIFATVKISDIMQGVGPRNSSDPVRVLITSLPDGYRLMVGRDLNEQRQLLDRMLAVILVAVSVMVLLALAGGVWMGRKMLRRIDVVRRTAGEIIEGDLSRRMPITTRDDEFDQLSDRLNVMLQRLEQLMKGMREVSDNLAHDLRKPLNRLRGRLEVTLLEDRTPAEYRDVLSRAIADADGLNRTFNALLSIAQAESGVRRDDWCDVELDTLLGEIADLYRVVAEEQGVRLITDIGTGISVTGNRQLLAQALSNLLDNAMNYTARGGTVRLASTIDENVPVILVADSGPGIPADEREHVFERFVRLDNARSTTGNGLGLSLVRAVVSLHRATIELEDNDPGLLVRIRFVEGSFDDDPN